MHGHQSGRRPSTPTLPSPASGGGIREGAPPQGDGYESTVVAEHVKRTARTEQTFQHSAKPAAPAPSPYAAFMPCRLCDASFTVKNTTSPSGVALPECTVLDGM